MPRLPRSGFAEIYAIDGGSTDGTVEYLQSQGIPVYQQPRRSLNAAYAHAVEKCTGDALVVFFPKGTISPDCVMAMARLLNEGYDLVVASRCIAGARNEEDEQFLRPRKWGVAALSCFAALLWRREGWRIRDVLHGVKAFTLAAYRRMHVAESGVTVDLEMIVRSYRLRICRTEFPVHESARTHGETKFKIWPPGKRLARFLWAELFCKI